MKKTLLALAFLLSLSLSLSAQKNYNTGIGLRLGPAYGLTVKHFLSGAGAIEGILHSRHYGGGRGWGGSSGFNLIGLYEHHMSIKGAPGLNWFVGIGGHIGHWRGWGGHKWYKEDRGYTTIGVDAIIGLEYTIPSAPLSLSLDWKPSFNLLGPGYWVDGVAFSIRFAIK